MSHGFLLESSTHECGVEDLTRFDGRRFAVVLTKAGCRIALRGTAHYVKEPDGGTLRIEVDDDSATEKGRPVFVVRGSDWDGRFVPDRDFGCEFQLRLDIETV
jgi:hypothetical protein